MNIKQRFNEKYYNNDKIKEIVNDCNRLLSENISFSESLYRDASNIFDFFTTEYQLDLSDYTEYHNNLISTFQPVLDKLLVKYLEIIRIMKTYYFSKDFELDKMNEYKNLADQFSVTYDQIDNIIIYSQSVLNFLEHSPFN